MQLGVMERPPRAIGSQLAEERARDAVADVRAIYQTHFPFVWRNLRRLGVPQAQLEDAAQEVFLVVHRRLSSFDASWSSMQTWLFGIVLRVAQNERRARRRRSHREAPAFESSTLETMPSESLSPAELMAKREAAELVQQTLETLSENERAIFVLVDVEMMSVPEAAEALSLKLNTAYGRLRTARAEFERSLRRIQARRDHGGSP
jgi:RNA polymerase sigma-70 factor (ECF subfamily)